MGTGAPIALRGVGEALSASLGADIAGRLVELVCVVSVALSATEKKIANTIETMAPWMQPEEAQMLVEHVQQMPIYERMPNNRDLGKRMRLTSLMRSVKH